MASGIVESDAITTTVVFAGLIGAIAWNLATWYFGLPSSSSHALIGGLVGAAFAASGTSAIQGDGLIEKVIVPGARRAGARLRRRRHRDPHRLPRSSAACGRASSTAATGSASSSPASCSRWRTAPTTPRRRWASSRSRSSPTATCPRTSFDVPTWVVVSSAAAIALGTYTGGWRIIRTMGTRIIKMDPAQGFSAQGAGAAVVLAASHLGFPLSTTHVISGGVMGAGAAKRLSAVRWGVAGNIAVAWVLTLPCAALIGAVAYGVTSIFGTGALGPARRVALDPRRRARLLREAHGARAGPHGRRMTVASIDWSQIFQLVWAATLAGVAVAVSFATLILGATRAADHRRADRHRMAIGLLRRRRARGVRLRGRRHLRDLDHRVEVAGPAANSIALSTLAGAPAAIEPAGTSSVTTQLAPMTQRSPIVTPLVTTTLAPHQTLSPTRVGPLGREPLPGDGPGRVVEAVVAVGDEAAVGEHAVRRRSRPARRSRPSRRG